MGKLVEAIVPLKIQIRDIYNTLLETSERRHYEDMKQKLWWMDHGTKLGVLNLFVLLLYDIIN